MLEHAIYSVITPEGCSAILWRDGEHAQEAAEALRLTAQDLLRLGIIDRIVPEPEGGAHLDPPGAAALLQQHLRAVLRDLRRIPRRRLLRDRYAKYRHVGRFGVYWKEIVRREMQEAFDLVGRRLPRAEAFSRGWLRGRGDA